MKPLLLIVIAILAAGCGGKDESTTDTKPVEEKLVEVKEEVKPEEPLAETTPELEGVNYEELKERESIWYLKDSETPYSGKIYALHPNGQKKAEANYKDGKLNGISLQWHPNGQKMSEVNFKDGKPDGLLRRWHENGQKEEEANFKDGKLERLRRVWHKNGQKMAEGNFKDGKQISAKYWNSKGQSVDSIEEAESEN